MEKPILTETEKSFNYYIIEISSKPIEDCRLVHHQLIGSESVYFLWPSATEACVFFLKPAEKLIEEFKKRDSKMKLEIISINEYESNLP